METGWARGATYANLATVMLLGGLWHGAKWNFVAWGAYHGLLLALERARRKRSLYAAWPHPARLALTFVLRLFSWVLFRADNLTAAMAYLAAMFGLGATSGVSHLLAAELYTPLAMTVLVLAAAFTFQPVQAHEWARHPQTWRRGQWRRSCSQWAWRRHPASCSGPGPSP